MPAKLDRSTAMLRLSGPRVAVDFALRQYRERGIRLVLLVKSLTKHLFVIRESELSGQRRAVSRHLIVLQSLQRSDEAGVAQFPFFSMGSILSVS
jgi:flagellar biosynthesis/type III secretory pathway ATPase